MSARRFARRDGSMNRIGVRDEYRFHVAEQHTVLRNPLKIRHRKQFAYFVAADRIKAYQHYLIHTSSVKKAGKVLTLSCFLLPAYYFVFFLDSSGSKRTARVS